MGSARGRTLLDRTFFVSLILKAIDGGFEVVGGVLLLIVTPEQIDAAAHALTRRELAEDPGDLIANWIVHYADSLDVSTTLFGAIYLLAHGVVKLVLVIAVLRDKLWAYPWLIGFLVAFIGFQVYEMVVRFSGGLFLLTLFDVFIVILTVREYRLHRQRRRAPDAQH